VLLGVLTARAVQRAERCRNAGRPGRERYASTTRAGASSPSRGRRNSTSPTSSSSAEPGRQRARHAPLQRPARGRRRRLTRRELASGLLADADTVVVYRQDESEIEDLVEKVGLTKQRKGRSNTSSPARRSGSSARSGCSCSTSARAARSRSRTPTSNVSDFSITAGGAACLRPSSFGPRPPGGTRGRGSPASPRSAALLFLAALTSTSVCSGLAG